MTTTPTLTNTTVTNPVYETTIYAPQAIYPSDWTSGVTLESEYKVEFLEFSGAAEQRICKAQIPYRSLTCTVFAATPKQEKYLRNIGSRLGVVRGVVPLYCDELQASVIPHFGDTSIPTMSDPALTRLCVGCKAAIVNIDTHEFEIVTVTAIIPGFGIQVSALAYSYPYASYIYPLMVSELSYEGETNYITDTVSDMQVRATEYFGEYALDPVAEIDRSERVWPFEFDWSNPLTIGYKRGGRMVGNGIASYPTVTGDFPRLRVEGNVSFLNRAEAWGYIQFFDSVRGSLIPFLFDLPTKPLTVVSIGINSLRVATEFDIEEWKHRKYVTMILKDGSRFTNQIVSAMPVAGGATVTFNSNWPTTNLALVDKCVLTYLMRFDTPVLSEKWSTTEIMSTTVSLVEVVNEKTLVFNLTPLY